MRVLVRTLGVVAIAIAIAVGCRPASPPPRPNILLIVVDTLRADRVGAFGNTRGLTPFLDSLAARGIVFHNAYASSSWTSPSVASLFTSRHVWQHRVNSFGAILAASEVTLAEVLRGYGYATAGRSANFLIGTAHGYAQGFDSYPVMLPQVVAGADAKLPPRATTLNREVLEWVRQRALGAGDERPAFIYLQYMEPHPPYWPPTAALETAFRGRPIPSVNGTNGLAWLANLVPADDPVLRDLEGMYDAEVLAIDMGIAELLRDLESTGFMRNAIVMITSDHGEGFWDHGVFGHGGSLFNELIHVPLIMLVPGQTTRVDVQEVVSLIDVAPTLLDLAGFSKPPSFVGQSFLDLTSTTSWRRRVRVAMRRWWGVEPRHGIAHSDMALNEQSVKKLKSSRHNHSVVVASSKLIATLDATAEYYDLSRDPHEKEQATFSPAEQAKLARALSRTGPPAGIATAGEVVPLDEERREQLRALGYVE